jgi:hypothetical protein
MKKKSFERRSLFWHYPHYGNQGGDPSAIIRKGDWKLIHYFENGKNELYHLGEDMEESTNVFDQNTQLGIALKNELKQWLESTGAKIPEKDPLHNDEEEEKWLSRHKQKIKLKVEKRRAFQLDPNYLPNEDWWGSTID